MSHPRKLLHVALAVTAIGLAAVAASCVRSGSTQCGDLVCPSNTTCMPGNQCIDTDLVQACIGKPNGATCTVPGLPPNKCEGGICQASICGDGRVTGSEQCDGSNLDGKTCQDVGFYSATGLACGSGCMFDTAGCSGYCGDGIINGPELCDGSNLGSASCFDVGFYAATTLACNNQCTYDTSGCTGGFCGDGIINGLEECDGSALGSATCASLGFNGSLSVLACSNACTFSSSSCLCTTGRCEANTQTCSCSKTGCACVNN